MSSRKPLQRADRSVIVTAEDVQRLLTEGLDKIESIGQEFAQASQAAALEYRQRAAAAHVEVGRPFEMPKFSSQELREEVARRVRAYLEDTVRVLPVADEDVNERDRKRALIVQALVRLKKPTLEAIVRSEGGVPRVGSPREIAIQVANSYGWEPSAVARLVLDHTEEPKLAAGGLSSRIFSMRNEFELTHVALRVRYALRRFIEVGTVKWFVFDTMTVDERSLVLEGRLRTFRPLVVEGSEQAELIPDETTHTARIVLQDGSRMVRVSGASDSSTARAALRALELLTGEQRQPWVSKAESEATPIPGRLHPQTEFLLDIATNKLSPNLFAQPNAVLARFRLSANTVAAEESTSANTPSVSAWRAEGRHLLDSPSACGLMATEGRPLVDLTLKAGARRNPSDLASVIHTRFALESDHVLIETGLASDIALVTAVHDWGVQAVESTLTDGVDEQAMRQLEAKILRKATGRHSASDQIVMRETL